MKAASPSRQLALCLILAVSSNGHYALAKEAASRAPLAESLSGEALSTFKQGRLLYEDGDFAGAAAKFKRAYELAKDPRLLWNMAACEKEQRHYARASTLVERYLKEGEGSIPADSQSQAQALLDSLKSFSSRLSLSGPPRGARVFVDGQKVGEVPFSALYVDLGLHKLRVEAPGYLPHEQSLEISGGDEIDLDVQLRVDAASSRLIVAAQAGDSIRIDGRFVGNGRWQGGLAPGIHRVQVTAPGKKPYESRVELAPKSQRTLEVVLPKDKAPLWPWIAGGGAVVAGAAAVVTVILLSNKTEVQEPRGSFPTIYND